jgi:HEAT repeat protein
MKVACTICYLIFLCLAGQSGQAQSLDSVLARLRSPTPAERVAALRELGKLPPASQAVEPLMSVLCDASADVRLEALKVWGLKARDYDEIVQKVHRYRRSLTKAQNDAEYEMWRNWQKQWLSAVVACADDSSEAVSKEAVRTLAKLGYASFSQPGYCIGTRVDALPIENQALSSILHVLEQQPKWLLLLKEEKDTQIAHVLIMALNTVDYPPVYPLLKQILQRSDSEWRLLGCVGLASKTEWSQNLLPLLSDSDNRVRESAVFGVVRRKDELLARLIPLFPQSSVPLRRSIVQLIRWEESGDHDALLTEACKDRDGDVVADALVVMKWRKSVSPKEHKSKIESDYARSLLLHPNPRVRAEAAELVWEQGGIKALDLFIPLLYDSSKEVQEIAMELLWEEKDSRLPAAYIHALRSTQSKETGWVSHILANNWKDSQRLVRSLLKDRNSLFRITALCALRNVEHPERLVWLSRAAHDPDAEVRVNVAFLLREKQGARETQLLLELLEDRERDVRRGAIMALIGTRDEKARSLLLRLAQSEDEDISDAAHRALVGKPR